MAAKALPEEVREKRASYRLVCTLPASVVISPRVHLVARVCNVSASGLKLVVGEPLRRHAEYTLMLPDASSQSTPFRVRCAWCSEARYESGFEAGCRFIDPAAAVAFLKTHWWLDLEGTHQRRRTIRIVRRYRCAFTDEAGRAGTGHTRDFSATGACIITRGPIEPGTRLSLTMMFRETISVRAEALRCEEIDKDQWDCSMRFVGVTRDQERQLVGIIDTLKRDWADGAT